MKTRTLILIIVAIFLLAGGVVWFVLNKANNTLSEAKKAADSAGKVTGDVKDFAMAGKKAWNDIRSIF